MDWDDEDEKTAVFDKVTEDASRSLLQSGLPPAAGAPAASASGRLGGSTQLLSSSGGTASVPPPSRAPTPPPPAVTLPAAAPAAFVAPAPASVAAPSVPPPAAAGNRTALIAVMALLLVGVIGGVVLLLLPKKGSLVVTVANPSGEPVSSVEILVDGKVACSATPCRVTDLEAGSKFVSVRVPGFSVPDTAVAVKGGEESVFNAILTATSSAPTAAAAGTGLRVSAEGTGLELTVDGKKIGPLPQELKDLTPGEHTLRIAGNDRFEVYEKKVTVTAGQIETIGPLKLKVLKGLAHIKAGEGADGAKIMLVSGNDRRPITTLPLKVDIPADKTYSLVATRPGYDDYKEDITFNDGEAERTFEVTLNKKGQAPAATKTQPQAPAGGTTTKPGTTPDKPATAPATASGMGTLNINSIPVSNVILDGKPLGTTPKTGLSVSAGNHTVVFVHPEHGRKARSVKVEAGKSATAAVRFP